MRISVFLILNLFIATFTLNAQTANWGKFSTEEVTVKKDTNEVFSIAIILETDTSTEEISFIGPLGLIWGKDTFEMKVYYYSNGYLELEAMAYGKKFIIRAQTPPLDFWSVKKQSWETTRGTYFHRFYVEGSDDEMSIHYYTPEPKAEKYWFGFDGNDFHGSMTIHGFAEKTDKRLNLFGKHIAVIQNW